MTIDQPTYQDPKYTVEYHCVCTVSAYISSLISLVMEDWNNCKRQARGFMNIDTDQPLLGEVKVQMPAF